jgi:hypothetical protein
MYYEKMLAEVAFHGLLVFASKHIFMYNYHYNLLIIPDFVITVNLDYT